MPRVRLAALAVGLAVALSACGGGSDGAESVDPTEWATDVCTAMSGYVESVEARAAGFEQAASGLSSIADAKAQVVQFFEDVVADTDVMLAAVDAAGTPSGDQGEEIRAALRSNLEPMREILSDSVAEAEELPTDNLADFTSQVEELTASVGEGFDEIGAAFDALDEFEGTFEGEEPEACQELAAAG